MDILAAGARSAFIFFTVDDGTGMPEGWAFPAGPSCMRVVRLRGSMMCMASSDVSRYAGRQGKLYAFEVVYTCSSARTRRRRSPTAGCV